VAPEIQVRLAVPEDAWVVSVLEAAFVEYWSSYTDEAFVATAPTRDKIEIRMNEGPMWVALYNEVIAGTVAAVSKSEASYVRGMGIVPTATGKRTGELLLKTVESSPPLMAISG
jgi:hypothetical protein